MQECIALCGTFSCLLGWADAHATAIVAVVAIAFTAWQLGIAKKHNRLSVRPRLVLWLDNTPIPNGNPRARLIVRNYGLGPAFLDSIAFRVRGRGLNVHDPAAMQDALTLLFGQHWAHAEPLFVLRGEYAIPKDGELPLLQILLDPPLRESADETLRENVAITIEYRSPYKEIIFCEWPPRT